MKTRKYLMIIFLMGLFASCSTTTPSVKVKEITVDNQFPMKVALIMPKNMKERSYLLLVKTPCYSTGRSRIEKDGIMSATVTVGSVNEELFEQLSRLFKKVDIYENYLDT